MKTNRELDELIYKLLHNVDEIPPPQEYVDFSNRSVEYVDQVPSYTENVDNALTLLDGIDYIRIDRLYKWTDGVRALRWTCYSWYNPHLIFIDESLAMAICLAWLAYKGYPNARDD